MSKFSPTALGKMAEEEAVVPLIEAINEKMRGILATIVAVAAAPPRHRRRRYRRRRRRRRKGQDTHTYLQYTPRDNTTRINT